MAVAFDTWPCQSGLAPFARQPDLLAVPRVRCLASPRATACRRRPAREQKRLRRAGEPRSSTQAVAAALLQNSYVFYVYERFVTKSVMDAPQHACAGCRGPLTWRTRVPEDHYATLGLRELRRDQYLCRECYTQLHYPWARRGPLRALRGAHVFPQFCVCFPRLLRTPQVVSASGVCALTACSDWWTTVCSSIFSHTARRGANRVLLQAAQKAVLGRCKPTSSSRSLWTWSTCPRRLMGPSCG
jgi:hypothetical protein